jgi:hypothetical protein
VAVLVAHHVADRPHLAHHQLPHKVHQPPDLSGGRGAPRAAFAGGGLSPFSRDLSKGRVELAAIGRPRLRGAALRPPHTLLDKDMHAT